MVNGESTVVGGSQPQEHQPAPKGRRFASVLIDLLVIPIVLGVIAGVSLWAVRDDIRNGILIAINIGWLLFRDLVFSPGRKMVGLKLKSTVGDRVTLLQVVVRNLTIAAPIALSTGYPCEIARVFFPALLWRRIWYSFIFLLALIGGVSLLVSAQHLLLKFGAVLAILIPPLFLVKDKENLPAGDRLMDVFAKTRVVSE
ncbi:MAG: hypothetical protein A3G87_00555 [Omnitrophica bacterium RIFCSPLOWO2_12_FULL_50_11]|nr:MAG: hypothetical protein A3G87_00555 [Omnitrophica bacterium RIFCSPLOWO2_12_FULL_50_11]